MTGNRNRSSCSSKLHKQLVYGLLAIIITIAIIGVVPVWASWASTPAELVQRGKIAYDRGDFPTALKLWEQAETNYHRDPIGVAGSQVNQAQALMGMGSYRRACKILAGTVRVDESVCATTIPTRFGMRQTNLPPKLQALAVGTLGDMLRLLGNLDAAQVTLATAGEIAKPLAVENRSPILLSLANTLRDLGNRDRQRTARVDLPSGKSIICPTQPVSNLNAGEYYHRAIACYRQADSLNAQINLLGLQVDISQWLKGRDSANWQQEFHQAALMRDRINELILRAVWRSPIDPN
jgi:tetratricopeptide (TPR) repeat protein